MSESFEENSAPLGHCLKNALKNEHFPTHSFVEENALI